MARVWAQDENEAVATEQRAGIYLPYEVIEVNGEQKMLRYDFNAVADLEEKFDTGIMELMTEKRIGFSVIRGLLWAGLKWKDKGLTLERAGKIAQAMMAEGQTFQDIMQPVMKAIKKSGVFGNMDKKEDGDEMDPNEKSPV